MPGSPQTYWISMPQFQTKLPLCHLVADDPQGAGCRHLTWTKPHCSQLGRHPQYEDLRCSNQSLAEECQPKAVRI
jgi:hypothetical protein